MYTKKQKAKKFFHSDRSYSIKDYVHGVKIATKHIIVSGIRPFCLPESESTIESTANKYGLRNVGYPLLSIVQKHRLGIVSDYDDCFLV